MPVCMCDMYDCAFTIHLMESMKLLLDIEDKILHVVACYLFIFGVANDTSSTGHGTTSCISVSRTSGCALRQEYIVLEG